MQPTFAVTLPRRNTKIEFLDESNPAKDTIIRKKAREWVNQNRDQGRKNRRKQKRAETEEKEPEAKPRDAQNMQLQRRKSEDPVLILSPLETVGTRQFDPFSTLPRVDTKYEHLLEYCKWISFNINEIYLHWCGNDREAFNYLFHLKCDSSRKADCPSPQWLSRTAFGYQWSSDLPDTIHKHNTRLRDQVATFDHPLLIRKHHPGQNGPK
jgi:hypothetical protein